MKDFEAFEMQLKDFRKCFFSLFSYLLIFHSRQQEVDNLASQFCPLLLSTNEGERETERDRERQREKERERERERNGSHDFILEAAPKTKNLHISTRNNHSSIKIEQAVVGL